MGTLVACPRCGFNNPPGARFCASCGHPQSLTCPECGAPVVEGARFCASCGIPLTGPTPTPRDGVPVLTAEARKVVTVLFADLVGSTGLTERLDPEEARDVIRKFYDVVQHVVERWFAGSVANLMGDAVLAVFGLPVAHEDDPERAVRAGLAIRDAMPVLNGHLAATHGVQLAVRVGINTGEVVAASGSTFDRDFLVSDAVTTAARLQQTVAPGTVIVGDRTYRSTRDAIEYRGMPPLGVKGKDAPVEVWTAVAPLPERADIKRATAPLVGRHAELGLLRHLYQRSREEERPHLVTIFGQPGVGKSRLLREFLAEVRELAPPPLVLRGRSAAFGGQIGYHALLDILRFQAGLLDTDPAETVREKLTRWLSDALPGRLDLLDGLLLTFGVQDGVSGDPVQIRQRLFETWQELIGGLAATRPIILALEDLHWADDGVLDLVQHLAEHLEASLLLISLARPDLLERRPLWGGGRRNATTIDLPPLRMDEAEQLVTALGSEGLRPDLVKLIAQRAEGNPLFAEELVRMMLESSTPGAAIPDTVQAVITARIDRLQQPERRALQAAAVVGRSFWRSAIAPIAGLSSDDTQRAIGALIDKELVVARPRSSIAGEREYAFRHILTRDVAYQILPRSQRQRAHLEAARWIESTMGERAEEVVEILAEHLRLAGDDTRAAAYLHRAGNKARRLYANGDAIRFFSQALEASEKAGLPLAQIAVVHRDRGDVYQLRGDYPAAMADFERGRDLAVRTGERALEAVLENRIGLVHHRQTHLEHAQTHYQRAAALARQIGDRLTLGQSLVDLANVSWDRGEIKLEDMAFMEGLTLLREAGDRASLARGLNLLCMAHLRLGNGEDAIAAATEARSAAHAAGDKSKEATSLSYLAVVNMYLGRYRQALDHGRDALTLAQEIEDRRRMAYTLDFLGRVQLSLGEWGEAIRLLREDLPLVREFAKGHLPWALLYMGIALDEIGSHEAATGFFRECAAIDPTAATFWQPIFICRVLVTRLARDGVALRAAAREIEELPWEGFVPAEAESLLPVGSTLVELGEVEGVRRFVAARRGSVEKLGAPPAFAALATLDGALALADRRVDDALGLLEQAVRWSRQTGNVVTERAALELRIRAASDPADRAALKSLLTRVANSLPDDLRTVFLASPRAALLRE